MVLKYLFDKKIGRKSANNTTNTGTILFTMGSHEENVNVL